MRRLLCCGGVAILLLVGAAALAVSLASSPGVEEHTMHFAGRERIYLVYLPPKARRLAEQPRESRRVEKLPLVLVFHGGGSTARQILRFSGFAELAEREGFLVVCPQGINKHWNDGRKSEVFAEQDRRIDDVAWIRALLQKLRQDYPMDPQRIYAVGISNGGFFCQRLAVELSDQLAAVASLTATLPEPLQDAVPRAPISVMFINGTQDPLVPYEGGEVTIRSLLGPLGRSLPLRSRGRVLSTDQAVRFWLRHNGIQAQGETTPLPDRARDQCRAELHRYRGGRQGTEVVLVKVIGGGHCWPGRRQYLPVERIGRACQDFSATELIWKFFTRCRKQQAKPASPTPK